MTAKIFTTDYFKLLFSLFQKLDYRDKENSGKKKLTGILAAYLFSNTILSYNFYLTYDQKSFIILALTSNLFLLSIIVLTDFENLFLASGSSDLLKTLPVKTSVIYSSKFFSAFIFLLFFVMTASVPQVIFFYLTENNLLKTIMFFVTGILFSYFAIGTLVLFYCAAVKYLKSKAVLLISLIQVLFFIFVFYSSTLSSRNISTSNILFAKQNILDISAVRYLPQTFFSNAVYDIYFFIICLLVSLAVYLLLYKIISINYFSLLETVKELKNRNKNTTKGGLFDFISKFTERFILYNHYERASFNLAKYELSNSRFLRVKYLPVMLMPLLIAVIGLITNASSLLFFNLSANPAPLFKTVVPVISPSITFTLLMCSRLLISNTKILDSNTNDTKWIYDSLPIKEKKSVIKGASKFVYALFVFPVIICLVFLLSIKADFTAVVLNMSFISSAMYLIGSVTLTFDKIYPFTLESSKFNSASKFLEIFLSILIGIILFLIQNFVFQNIIFVVISIITFIIISILLNRNLK